MTSSRPTTTRRRRRARGQRGIALLAVITAVAICLVIVNEFGTHTTIDEMQARNNLDQMRGHFLARSAFSLTEIVIQLQHQLDAISDNASGPGASQMAALSGVQITDYADSLMAAFGGDSEQVQGAIGMDVTEAKGLGSDIGTFGVHITPLDGKINVNCAGDSSTRAVVAKALQSMLYPPAFDPVFQDPDATGWRRDRDQQVLAIVDYIDHDQFKSDFDSKGDLVTTSAPEDYGYENLRDPYKPKNNPLDSVDEMKLIRGVDERFWTLFGHAFRVQGPCKVSLRGLDDPILIIAIISAAAKVPNDPALRDSATLWTIANLVITAKQYGEYFAGQDGLNDFIGLVGDPAAYVAGLSDPSKGPPPPGMPPLPQLPPGTHGIELNSTTLNKLVATTAITTYQVEAWGEVDRTPFPPMRRTMNGIWYQGYSGVREARGALAGAKPNGAWQYLREE